MIIDRNNIGSDIHLVLVDKDIYVGVIEFPTEKSTIKDYENWRSSYSILLCVSDKYGFQIINHYTITDKKAFTEIRNSVINSPIEIDPVFGTVLKYIDFRDLYPALCAVSKENNKSSSPWFRCIEVVKDFQKRIYETKVS